MKKLGIGIAIGLWVSLSAAGFVQLIDYEAKPGELGNAPEEWPEGSRLINTREKPTIVFFAHPRCPCTEASLTELSRITAHTKDKANINVVFYKPKKFKDSWAESSLFKRTKKLYGEKSVFLDKEGFEIKNFEPKTSGQLYLYSKTGNLIYSGGITASRGHEGDNLGSKRVLDYLVYNKKIEKKFSVYGCSLFHNGRGLKQALEVSKKMEAAHAH